MWVAQHHATGVKHCVHGCLAPMRVDTNSLFRGVGEDTKNTKLLLYNRPKILVKKWRSNPLYGRFDTNPGFCYNK